MLLLPRRLLSLPAALVWVLASGPASAWVESSVLSDAVTIEIEPQGQAVVSHDLWMRIRGGPLKGTELDGIDSDAEPMADAEVVKISNGSRVDQTKPLLLSRGDDDTLHIEVDDQQGLRNGTYSFRFKYRTDLRSRSRIGLRGSWSEIAWVGPRYPAGLDVAKVTFRVPHNATAPRLPEIDPSTDGVVQGELPTAAFLSTLRRGSEKDELELVRPHVAKGEPVLWRVWASPTTFPWFAEAKRERRAAEAPSVVSPRSPLGKGSPLLLAFLLAVATAVGVLMKDRCVSIAAAQQNCVHRPWVALGPHLRAASSAILLGLALLLAVRFDAPATGTIALLLGLTLMIYRRPVRPRQLRGPGRWLPLHPDEAFGLESAGVRSGRYLDASTRQGKGLLVVAFLLTTSCGVALFRTQPYLAVIVGLATVIPWPLLLTGRAAELPRGLRNRDRVALKRMYRRLRHHSELRVHVVGRFVPGESQPDEIRLKIASSRLDPRITGVEVAALGPENSGKLCLLVRLADGREGMPWLPGAKSLSRGRHPDERVFAYLPTLAAQSRLLALLGDLLLAQSAIGQAYGTAGLATRTKASRSSGSGSETSKPSRAAVPGQATRAA